MNLSRIRDLIRLVEASEIDELEVSRWGDRVRILKTRSSDGTVSAAAAPARALPAAAPAPPSEPSPAPAPEAPRGLVIKSPMVGTFYRASSPDARPFAEVGTEVSAGQVVCIIEAMKLMNEIQADVSGRIERILVENAQPVEYGQPLFLLAAEAGGAASR